MKKCKYFIGCYGFGGDGKFKTIRIVTKIQDGTPLFEKDVAPLEFTSEEADMCMRELLDKGWAAVTLRVPHDRSYMCWN